MTFLLSLWRRRLGSCHVGRPAQIRRQDALETAAGTPRRYLLTRYRLARKNLISPVVVRTFSVGPPPFNLPSAEKLLGPGQSPPSLVTRMSLKSDMILCPFARSMLARIVM